MKFAAGVSGNPKGRPKGTVGGRAQALILLDEMMARKANKRALLTALQSLWSCLSRFKS